MPVIDLQVHANVLVQLASRSAVGQHSSVPVLVHFVASWADAICGPHRAEVEAAAEQVGAEVLVVDVDQSPEAARAYQVLNVPAVAIEGAPESVVVGAFPATDLLHRLGFT